MKFTVATFLLGLAAVNAVDLTPAELRHSYRWYVVHIAIGLPLGLASFLSPSPFSFPRIHTTPPYY
jgi:hypothetical protein